MRSIFSGQWHDGHYELYESEDEDVNFIGISEENEFYEEARDSNAQLNGCKGWVSCALLQPKLLSTLV